MWKFRLVMTLLLAAIISQLSAQNKDKEVLRLWTEAAPNQNGKTDVATITVYHPSRPNGMAIIMCPGGAYGHLALTHEGHDMASWFTTLGVTYIVLQYRLPYGHDEVPLSDAEQAVRLVRKQAVEWKVNPNSIGIMGGSAGGHLAASLATLYSSDEVRPDFQILLYPVISMEEGRTNIGSRNNLIGKNPTREMVEKYSLEKHVSSRTPQAFIVLSADDGGVLPVNSIDYCLALNRFRVSVSMHIYPTGGHGWGFKDSFTYKTQWTGELEKWLRDGLVQN